VSLRLTSRGLWAFGRYLPCSIGRSGITKDKREGDWATPAGVHRIVGCLYRPDRLVRPNAWAVPIRPGDLWSDDVADKHYNHLVRAPHGFSHEMMRRPDPLYDVVLVLDWNWPDAVPGKGSAIFIHQLRRPGYPTAGCIALKRYDLLWLARRVTPGMSVRV
jgi:L,D-peptidoglycan transpeptidase YkuD (ErfK/YbiS/YcfS/YnhG family)